MLSAARLNLDVLIVILKCTSSYEEIRESVYIANKNM